MTKVSVVIATFNPQRDVIQWALDSLANQTLPKSEFEVVVVDNNSSPPLDEFALSGSRGLRLRIVREPQQGIAFTRCTGIQAAASDLIVFLDDDNYIDPDYLEKAVRVAGLFPTIGAFGGISRLLCEVSIPAWKRELLPYLGVRDYGSEAITSNEDRWGHWEPIGAGMAFRRDVGLEFVRVVNTDPMARLLGRAGGSFIGGEDSLLARLAYRLGYSCSYQPSLKMTHMIKSTRLSARRLARLVEGIARGHVIGEMILGRPQPHYGFYGTLRELVLRCRHRVKEKGFRAGLVEWHWDVGYFRQARLLQKRSSGARENAEVFHSHSEL